MATSFLLKPNLTLTNQCSLIQLSPINPLARSPNFPRLITNPKITLKCSVSSENLTKPGSEPFKRETKTNPCEVFASAVLKSLKTLQEATVALVLFMAMGFMSFYQNSALAAGGGRMGGSDFSSSSSSSSSSWSSPSFSSSSWSSPSSSSSSWSSPSSSSSSYLDDDDYSMPSYKSSSVTRSSKSGGGDVTLVESVNVATAKPALITHSFWSPAKLIVATLSVLCVLTAIVYKLNAPNEASTPSKTMTSVEKSILILQVGVLGSAKSLQKELDRIAKTADTSTKAGLTYILTETTSAVLQHPDYCISAYLSVDVKSDMKDVETLYNRLSIEERAKLDEETLVNVNNQRKQSTSCKETTGFNNEYIVITIIVAAEGVFKLPKISSSEDLKEALKIISSVTTNKTLGVEILWTPQDENEILTERDVLEKYPLLRSLDTL